MFNEWEWMLRAGLFECSFVFLCLCSGVNAPGSGPHLRGPPPGSAEIFQPITERRPESAGE